MSESQVKLGDTDLVQGRRRNKKDLGFVRRDVGVVDDAGQVGLVPVERNMLMVRGQRDAGIIGTEQDELIKSALARILHGFDYQRNSPGTRFSAGPGPAAQ